MNYEFQLKIYLTCWTHLKRNCSCVGQGFGWTFHLLTSQLWRLSFTPTHTTNSVSETRLVDVITLLFLTNFSFNEFITINNRLSRLSNALSSSFAEWLWMWKIVARNAFENYRWINSDEITRVVFTTQHNSKVSRVGVITLLMLEVFIKKWRIWAKKML